MEEAEVEAMIVRIKGDTDDVNRKMAESVAKTHLYGQEIRVLGELLRDGIITHQEYGRAAAQAAQQAGIAQKSVTDHAKSITAPLHQAMGALKTTGNLMRQRFETTGQAMGMLGSIAKTIPGPWGAAVGMVLGSLGEIIDWFEGPLKKNQAAAKKGFMSMASGGKTAAQAVQSIRNTAMNEAMEDLIKIEENKETLFGNVANAFREMETTIRGESSLTETTLNRMNRQMETRLRMLRERESDPALRNLRRTEAVEQAGVGSLTRQQAMPIRTLRRRQQRAMMDRTGRQGGAETVRRLNEQVAIMELINKTRETSGVLMSEEEARTRLLRDANFQLAQSMVEGNIILMRRENAITALMEATRKWEQELRASDDTFMQLAAQMQGATKIEVTEMKLRAKNERDLRELRRQGWNEQQLAERQAQMEASVTNAVMNAAAQEALAINNRNLDAREIYERAMRALNQTYANSTMTLAAYNREAERLGNAFDRSAPDIVDLNRAIAAGSAAMEATVSPMERLERQIRDVARAYAEGHGTQEQYQLAVERLRHQQDMLNASLDNTKASLSGTAEAFGKIRKMQEMMTMRSRPEIRPPDPVLTTNEQRLQEVEGRGIFGRWAAEVPANAGRAAAAANEARIRADREREEAAQRARNEQQVADDRRFRQEQEIAELRAQGTAEDAVTARQAAAIARARVLVAQAEGADINRLVQLALDAEQRAAMAGWAQEAANRAAEQLRVREAANQDRLERQGMPDWLWDLDLEGERGPQQGGGGEDWQSLSAEEFEQLIPIQQQQVNILQQILEQLSQQEGIPISVADL